MSALDDVDSIPTRVNLGCGWDRRQGYLNVDLYSSHNPDLVADVSELQMLPSNHFEEALAQDILEHMPRKIARKALAEWARILKPNGIITIRVPGLIETLSLLKARHRSADSHAEIEHLLYGTQAYNGDFHQSGYTFPMLSRLGINVGLMVIESKIIDGWMIEFKFEKCQIKELDNIKFIQHIYATYLGRPADESGYRYFLNVLDGKKMTRESLVDFMSKAEL